MIEDSTGNSMDHVGVSRGADPGSYIAIVQSVNLKDNSVEVYIPSKNERRVAILGFEYYGLGTKALSITETRFGHGMFFKPEVFSECIVSEVVGTSGAVSLVVIRFVPAAADSDPNTSKTNPGIQDLSDDEFGDENSLSNVASDLSGKRLGGGSDVVKYTHGEEDLGFGDMAMSTGARNKFVIYAFGANLIQASQFCFRLYNKTKNKITESFRNRLTFSPNLQEFITNDVKNGSDYSREVKHNFQDDADIQGGQGTDYFYTERVGAIGNGYSESISRSEQDVDEISGSVSQTKKFDNLKTLDIDGQKCEVYNKFNYSGGSQTGSANVTEKQDIDSGYSKTQTDDGQITYQETIDKITGLTVRAISQDHISTQGNYSISALGIFNASAEVVSISASSLAEFSGALTNILGNIINLRGDGGSFLTIEGASVVSFSPTEDSLGAAGDFLSNESAQELVRGSLKQTSLILGGQEMNSRLPAANTANIISGAKSLVDDDVVAGKVSIAEGDLSKGLIDSLSNSEVEDFRDSVSPGFGSELMNSVTAAEMDSELITAGVYNGANMDALSPDVKTLFENRLSTSTSGEYESSVSGRLHQEVIKNTSLSYQASVASPVVNELL